MRRTTMTILIIVVLLVIASVVLAEDGRFEVAWYRVAGGGGNSGDAARFSLAGLIGQFEAGTMSDGSRFVLSGGYWDGGPTGTASKDLYLPLVLGPKRPQ